MIRARRGPTRIVRLRSSGSSGPTFRPPPPTKGGDGCLTVIAFLVGIGVAGGLGLAGVLDVLVRWS